MKTLAVLYTNRTAEDKPITKSADVQSDFEKYPEKSGVGKGLSLELRERTWSPDLYYLHGDHLGTATFVTNSQSQATQFFLNLPFGETMMEQMDGSYDNPFKFNAKELDDDTGLYYYGARYNNPRLSIWYGVDPLAEDMPSWSPYNYTFDNPVRYTDPDGQAPNDIVYINNRGVEVHRIKSDTQFKTYIQATTNASSNPSRSTAGWKQVAMPNIIQSKGGEDVSGSAYQKNDYQIAARTGYFNQAKNSGKLNLVTEGGNPIPQVAIKGIPDLDPTLVKAMTIQESNAGTTGVTDIMQTNVKADWNGGEMKSNYGLKQGEGADVSTSLYAGTRILGTKGFKGGITYDPKTGKSTYNFKGWFNAAGSYNSTAGTKGYQADVQKMYQNSKKPTPKNYK
ncbi:RHS repeat-associated core domain-containing protein [Chryseobacterium sp. 3008163]|uniref:RHS repeat-associated core domain-containing protein n=1 Tax=Chryseobacterium sp. 3008163 TaxID=2478663 RepID=UPI000F0CE3B7|nr:RHS repeat-associated core domain-containing protein [Chryseobacterium sp. 3008163]AYM99604.1 RHS repeat-associated core domain-containing protein [Chryseobacterium sp. 3008163]